MDDARAVLGTAEQLYAAVAAPKLWPDALDALVEFIQGRHGFLHVGSQGGAFVAYARVDERDVLRLTSPEALRMSAPLHRLLPLGVATRNELVSDHEFARSQCYNELFRPLNGFHSIHLRQAEPARFFALTICRDRQADNFAAEETAKVRAIEPHLANALALCHRLGVAEHWTHGLARTLDRLGTGVILTDIAARPVFANARAMRIVSEDDGLSHQGDALAAATPAATQELRQALLRASRSGNGAEAGAWNGCEEQQLCLARPSGRAPLLLAILPIWRLDVAIAGLPAPRVAVFVTEPDAPCAIDRSAVADTFRLTRREADVALLLAAGCDLPDIAARLGLGLSTVRSHLKRVFYKTDVHSQGALAALVRGFVAPFD
jgi:DNA-binding CsgD family transcriptional regulator